MAKVSVVKWSQNLIFVEGSGISGVPNFLKIPVLYAFLKTEGEPEMAHISTKMWFWGHFTIGT